MIEKRPACQVSHDLQQYTKRFYLLTFDFLTVLVSLNRALLCGIMLKSGYFQFFTGCLNPFRGKYSNNDLICSYCVRI